MKKILTAPALAATLAMGFLARCRRTSNAQEDWQQQVAQALGKAGSASGGVYRVGLPRTDIKATLDGVELKPGFALGGWLAFEKMGGDAMVMGDLVLTEDEVNPVMAKLLAGGLAGHGAAQSPAPQPALHHVHACARGGRSGQAGDGAARRAGREQDADGVGSAASGRRAARDRSRYRRARPLLGAKGTNNGGIFQYGIPRAEPIKHGDMAVPDAMGLANAINFQPTGAGKAAITGDFVLIDKEVAPVMKALRDNGIEVTALHNHMVDEQPRLYFMHFWAHDDALKLAAGLKAALGHINVTHG